MMSSSVTAKSALDLRTLTSPERLVIKVPGLQAPPDLMDRILSFLADSEAAWTGLDKPLSPDTPGFGFALSPVVPFGTLSTHLNVADPQSFVGFSGVMRDGQLVTDDPALARYPAYVLRKFFYLLKCWKLAKELHAGMPSGTLEARGRAPFANLSVPLTEDEKLRPDGSVPWTPFPVGGAVYVTDGRIELMAGTSRWPQHIDPIMAAALAHLVLAQLHGR